MKFIKTGKIMIPGFNAITIFPFVFVRSAYANDPVLINHENIHGEQYKELWVLGFWFLYLWYYGLGIYRYRNLDNAYRRIPFEQEAYINAEDDTYLKHREKFAWCKYRV